ncbi:hypothetical protein [Pseudoalteromonas sp. S16_S37]|uniref:hypothetical protein n=1 Tax=Pseudoalteromonas sp. S16_S37 TaxID=2720228 RepID=UPI0016812978|nr:hypothetical protein [Pseudoalteromonas sp. S16_S37]MBD1584580.1 hypothetical protein [Pseudoalteromonas sp. S16_S37]
MDNHQSRAKFLQQHPKAKAHAALDDATNQQLKVTPGPVKLTAGKFTGKICHI